MASPAAGPEEPVLNGNPGPGTFLTILSASLLSTYHA